MFYSIPLYILLVLVVGGVLVLLVVLLFTSTPGYLTDIWFDRALTGRKGGFQRGAFAQHIVQALVESVEGLPSEHRGAFLNLRHIACVRAG